MNLPSSGKRWVDEGRPIAFKTLFFEIPHRGETKFHETNSTSLVSNHNFGFASSAKSQLCSAQSTVYRV